ncbi:hypothetical protein [Chitinibacter sp. GC72]|uniref:hypothetical protein n=1 Tax=Chitinibacter sp. GC72 TaxID=1526917 RepID=UPI0012FBBD44|nr:hypothetical protein [Chitinibacter sp. GC72]
MITYEGNFSRILSSIFGATDKPPLGSAPAHTISIYNEIGGITKADNLVLKESCEYCLQSEDFFIDPEQLFPDVNTLGFKRSEIKDCIEILEQHGYITVSHFIGGGLEGYGCRYQITEYGFETYAAAYIANYSGIVANVISEVVNNQMNSNLDLQTKTAQPITLINHILTTLESRGHVNLVKYLGGNIHVYNVAASLRRLLAVS